MIQMRQGRPTGIAYVEFPLPTDIGLARSRMDKAQMGSRYIEVRALTHIEAAPLTVTP